MVPPDDIDREELSSLNEDYSPDNGFGVTVSNADNAAAYAELDSGELEISEDSSKLGAADKVELDLEDAPFLEEEEEEEETKPSDEVATGKGTGGATLPRWKGLVKNRRFQIAAAILLVLLIAIAIALAVILQPSDESSQEPAQQGNQTVPVQTPEEPEPEAQTLVWDPFWVEYVVDQGEVRFLHAKFATATTSEKLAFEISRKQTFLAEPENAEALKRDLLSVVNQYLTTGQVDTLLIEEYLIK